MSRPVTSLMVPLRPTRIEPDDRILAESEGRVAERAVEVRLTCKGLYLRLEGGRTFGVNLHELASLAAARLEAVLADEGDAP
ncbi:MAG: hypothetical protein U1E48_04570 [Paracoccaceae bacterium]